MIISYERKKKTTFKDKINMEKIKQIITNLVFQFMFKKSQNFLTNFSQISHKFLTNFKHFLENIYLNYNCKKENLV